MLRSLSLGLAAVVLALSSAACAVTEGSGVPASETRAVSAFTRLEIRQVNARIEVDPNVTAPTIEVRGDDNLVRRVQTRVEGSSLIVDAGDDDVDPELALEVVFKTAALTEIDAVGGSRIDVKMESEGTLKVHAAGGARITSRGRIGRLDADLAGDARLEARYLVAKTVELDAAGGAFAAVCATDRLEADLAGGAEADYYCDPHTIDREVSSGAHLHAR